MESSESTFRTSFVDFVEALDMSQLTDNQKLNRLHQLFKFVITHVTDDTQIQFTSIYSRLSYLIGSYSISGKDSYLLHSFRMYEASSDDSYNQKYYKIARAAIDILGEHILEITAPYDIDRMAVFTEYARSGKSDIKKFIGEVRIFAKSLDQERGYLLGQTVDEPFENVTIHVDRADGCQDFYPLLQQLDRLDHFPLYMNLIDVEIDQDSIYHPSSIVFEPDYLYDVTSISECFGPQDVHQLSFLLRRFINRTSGAPLIIGNIANYFLDQLIYHPELSFDDVKKDIFSLAPLELAGLDDQEVREMISLLIRHFHNLKRVVNHELVREGIEKDQSYIEPAFYSSKYGIQGRLDLFSYHDSTASIVELKSGSPFRANRYGLSNNHYHQTLLYDMLVESVYGRHLKRKNFILYSKEMGNNLRYAPSMRAQQRETIKLRNVLYLTDVELRKTDDFFNYLQTFYNRFEKGIKGYQLTDTRALLKTFQQLSSIEKSYAQSIISFVLTEHQLSKLGDDSKDRLTGLASLWRDDLMIKIEQFNIINHLRIFKNDSISEEPILLLEKSSRTAELSNFRIGDLAILYKDRDDKESILRDQVFKCTVLNIDDKYVKIRLRSRQQNTAIFQKEDYWNIEHDSLENGFYAMTRSLFEFAGHQERYRQLILGSIPPSLGEEVLNEPISEMTAEQNQLYNQMINAEDYYLLWGPPGTGKTSIMLKHLSAHYYDHTTQRILLLAYTNRAVDEICRALEAIESHPEYVRIGSRYSTAVEYQDTLLNEQLSKMSSRKALVNYVDQKRVYVGTVASILGKQSLFNLVKFDLAIIDEASQILDGSLIGLLGRVPKFILIGDHLQLPAVVRQSIDNTAVMDESLQNIGIKNLSDSLFERLYRRAKEQKWDHAIGQLSHQGRMHEELMAFPNEHFYNGTLRLLTQSSRLTDRLAPQNTSPLVQVLSHQRLIYIPVDIDIESDNIKVNEHEAHIVVELLKALEKMAESYGGLHDEEVGVITPYRAQIARIVSNIQKTKLADAEKVTVDTVERYQGGARDRVILSTSINLAFQMRSLVSLSGEGIDRKLNVAFTRAREQFILIGNEDILGQNKVYADLINRSYRLDPELIYADELVRL